MPEPLLSVRNLDAFYGDFQALFGVSIEVAAGEAVAVIGANGAGKSTLLKCIAGAMRSRGDAIVFQGAAIGDLPAYAVAARGVALVPEGRGLFPSLGVEENLLIGGQLGRSGPWTLARIYDLFPVLAERRAMPSQYLPVPPRLTCNIGSSPIFVGVLPRVAGTALRLFRPTAGQLALQHAVCSIHQQPLIHSTF